MALVQTAYRGAIDKVNIEGCRTTFNLVLRLLKADVLLEGYHNGVDSFFSFTSLFLALYDQSTLGTGTLTANRKDAARLHKSQDH